MPPMRWTGWSASWPMAKPGAPQPRRSALPLAVALERAEAPPAPPNWRWPRRPPRRPGSRPNGASPKPKLAQTAARLERLENETARHAAALAALGEDGDADAGQSPQRRPQCDAAALRLAEARAALDAQQARKAELQSARDNAAAALSAARAELTGGRARICRPAARPRGPRQAGPGQARPARRDRPAARRAGL